MGIVGFMPLLLLAVGLLISKLGGLVEMPAIIYVLDGILFLLGVVALLVAFVAYFVWNIRVAGLPRDDKIGWGYMIVCLSVFAIPLYWYKNIYHGNTY